MQCKQCKTEFKSKRADALYCSDKCRKAHKRTELKRTKQAKQSGQVPYEIITDKQIYKRQAVRYKGDKYGSRPKPDSATDRPDPQNRCIYTRADRTMYIVDASGISIDFQDNPLKDRRADELYNAINNYEADTWKHSNEFKELMRRLKALPIEALQAQGYKIPNWKYREEYQEANR